MQPLKAWEMDVIIEVFPNECDFFKFYEYVLISIATDSFYKTR